MAGGRDEGRAVAREVAMVIRRHADQFSQDDYCDGCGTPQCIAGFTAWVDAGKPASMDLSEKFFRPMEDQDGKTVAGVDTKAVHERAKQVLQLTDEEAYRMFQPYPYGRDMDTSPTAAARMLDRYAEKGVVQWFTGGGVPEERRE